METTQAPNRRPYPRGRKSRAAPPAETSGGWGRPRWPASELAAAGEGYVRVGVRLVRQLDARIADLAQQNLRYQGREIEALLTAWVERARRATAAGRSRYRRKQVSEDRDRRAHKLRLPVALLEELDVYAAAEGLSRERMVETALLEQLGAGP